MSTTTVTQYAITDESPPQAWSSEWVLYNGDRIAGGDPPKGFRLVEEAEYQDALRAQDAAVARNVDQANHEYRLELSRQRKMFKAAGLPDQVIRVLLPDPNNDYSIDQ